MASCGKCSFSKALIKLSLILTIFSGVRVLLFKEVKVTCTKTTEPICIQDGYGWPLTEMALANLVGTPTNFKDEMNDTGTVRTITPADE